MGDEVDRHAIDALFLRLGDVGSMPGRRDPELEGYLLERLGRSPAVAYALVRTLLAKEEALDAARAQLARLEHRNLDEVTPAGARRGAAAGFGSTILDIFRFDGSTAGSRRAYDPDDVDALGFDEEPDRR